MIKSNVKAFYGSTRKGTQEAFMLLTVHQKMTPENVQFEIQHYALLDEETCAKTLVDTSFKSMSIAEWNQFYSIVNSYMDDHDTSTMSQFEIEQLRLKIGLLLYIKTDFLPNKQDLTVWELLPENWELV